MVVAGGDGSILRVIGQLGEMIKPIFGINVGSLGFLTEVPVAELYATLEAVEQKRFTRDSRSLLQCCVQRGEDCIAEFLALNDMVVTKSEIARMTAVDITPKLIAIGTKRAEVAGRSLMWVTADASDTGLPDRSFDAAVSNMGTIFVEPTGQVTEFGRLLKAGGVLAFSSWVHDTANPFFSPILNVLGAPRRPATRPINGVTRPRPRRDCRPTSTTSRSNPPFTLGNSRRWTRQCASSRMSHQCTYRCSATSTKRSTTGW